VSQHDSAGILNGNDQQVHLAESGQFLQDAACSHREAIPCYIRKHRTEKKQFRQRRHQLSPGPVPVDIRAQDRIERTGMIFSVIVPFLNEELRIEACIDSLLNQTFNNRQYEIIFIDNGSTDRSAQIVRKYPAIKLLYETRRDPYLARNRGIEAAQGKYLAFTDADCVAGRYWLAEFQKPLQDCDIVMGRVLYPAPASVFLQCYEHYYHKKIAYLLQKKMKQCYYGHAGNMAVKASVFKAIGLFSGMPTVGDTEVIHKLLEHDPDAAIAYTPMAQVVHTEVRHFKDCLYKLFECGQYSETYSSHGSYRPLHFRERLRVLQTCIADRPYNPFMIAALTGTLVLGCISFEAGRLTRRSQSLFIREWKQ
jgi:GT2 family glycosyltransferase